MRVMVSPVVGSVPTRWPACEPMAIPLGSAVTGTSSWPPAGMVTVESLRVNASLPVVARLRVTGVVPLLVKVTGSVTGVSVGWCGHSK